MENKYAFISYQTNDIDDAYWVKKVLIENGINCWTVNEKADGEAFADMGIDFITTNILE